MAPLRLHLGCGETYLKGYVNIDFPQDEHTTITIKADEYKDLKTLAYPEGTVDEVRNHHVLEHFNRGEAVGLLLKWRRWLKTGGILMVETPDFEESARDFLRVSFEKQGELARHIFGSHEAPWATHYDGWFEKKFRFALDTLGFEVIKIVKTRNNLSRRIKYTLPTLLDVLTKSIPENIQDKIGLNVLPNILCVGRKKNDRIDEMHAAEKILTFSLIGKEKENKVILKVWLDRAKKILDPTEKGNA